MTETIAVFVNDRRVTVDAGARAAGAVALADPALSEALRDGRAYLTDGRGLRLDPDAPLHAGAIVRAVVSARRDAAAAGGDDARHA